MRGDTELLRAWHAGDAAAGRELFSRHYAKVERFFRNKATRDHDDLIQHTFLACIEGVARYDGNVGFQAYLYGCAWNVLKGWLTEKHRVTFDPHVTTLHQLDPSPSSIAARRQEQADLVTALRRLPLDKQVILELVYWERWTAQELAEFLACPEGTAKSRLRLAKACLRTELLALQRGRSGAGTELEPEVWAAEVREQLIGRPATEPSR